MKATLAALAVFAAVTSPLAAQAQQYGKDASYSDYAARQSQTPAYELGLAPSTGYDPYSNGEAGRFTVKALGANLMGAPLQQRSFQARRDVNDRTSFSAGYTNEQFRREGPGKSRILSFGYSRKF